LNFTASKYQLIKDKWSITRQLFIASVSIFVFFIFLKIFNSKLHFSSNIQDAFFPFILLGFILFLLSLVYQFFDFERIENKKDGTVTFNENEIVVDYNKIIKYQELIDLEIRIEAYYGERINIILSNPNEKKSLGIRNHMTLVTKDNILKFNFKLENELHRKRLEKSIFNLILSEKVVNVDLKKQINLITKEYKETSGFKNFMIKQILEKKINCTEGLLLYGYKTDVEAADLRKKYCS